LNRSGLARVRTSNSGFRISNAPFAFTLIELILAIGIMAIVMIAINAVFFSALKLRESTVNSVEASLPVQQALAILRRDLEGAVPPAESGTFAGNFKSGNVISLGTAMPVDIEFNTTTGIIRNDEPWGEIQKVSYGLRPPANRNLPGNDLYRNITRNLLATITPQPEEHWMMGGVDSIEFTCYDGVQWRNDWDTSITDTNLPLAVRVHILLASADGVSDSGKSIEMVIPIASQSRTNLLAVTEATE
jgi:type II secretion system protein J